MGTELNRLIITKNWEYVTQHISRKPQEASSWSIRPGFFEGVRESKLLPIHQCCALDPPESLLKELYRANPKSVKCLETAYKRNPLHIATRYNAKPAVVRFLVTVYPKGAGEEDILGRLPIHYSCSNGAPTEQIELLLNACPGGSRAFDKRGWLPLHVACSVGADPIVIQRLLEIFPESVVINTNKGSNALKCCEMAEGSPNTPTNIALVTQMIQKIRSQDKRPAAKPTEIREVV